MNDHVCLVQDMGNHVGLVQDVDVGDQVGLVQDVPVDDHVGLVTRRGGNPLAGRLR
ncbi:MULTISPECIES: hypothetical protein [unclassified Nonomuraea]|uniref:hypothetical protein n=1 Tax=unclassified Nonomuraea TaxID=2593643 RepID=UPI0033CFC7DD